MPTAKGTFSVVATRQPQADPFAEMVVGRMKFNKIFEGDFVAESVVEMLSFSTGVDGSAVYVAIERLSGTLGGKTGTFAMHHTGIMVRGVPNLSVRVVPDSAKGELAGLTGTLQIEITGGQHFYTFEYDLAGA